MPTPHSGENHDDFMTRCMADPEANQDFPDPAQRYAFCSSQWERRAMTMDELLAKLKARPASEQFGYGLTTADAYVRNAIKAVGMPVASKYFGDVDEAFVLKEAERKLAYVHEESGIEEKLTSLDAMKAILPKDVELPKNTLMVIKHKLTTPREDRDRDILKTEGAIVDPKMPLLWQHMHTLPVGRRLATLTHDAKVLRLASVLIDLNDLTADAAKLIEADVLRFSHGFITKEWEDRYDKSGAWLGFIIKAFEILEASLVSVPSNVDAEIELYSRDKLKSDLFKSHAKSLFDARPVTVPGASLDTKTPGSPDASASGGDSSADAPGDPSVPDQKPKWKVYYDGAPAEPGSAEYEAARAAIAEAAAKHQADAEAKEHADANCESLSQLADEKAGRELSKANLKILQAVYDDLAELAEDESLKRAAAALVVRCRDQLKDLIDRVTGDDDDDKTAQVVVELSLTDAAQALLASDDTELKQRVGRALQAQLTAASLTERGRKFRTLLRPIKRS